MGWQPVDGSKASLIHYGNPGETSKDATFMGYSETNTWTLPADKVPAHKAGDVINFYVQEFAETGTGADGIAKAEELNSGQHLGSEWSEPASVKFA